MRCLKLSTLAAVLCAGQFGFAQDPAPPDAKSPPPARAPKNPPRRPAANRPQPADQRVPDSVQVVRDVVYAIAPDKDGNPIELKMDTAFLKRSDGKPMPVVVYIHGGGWKSGSREMGLRPSIALALGGYFAATIDYRLTDQATFPAGVHDCKAAIRFLRAHAEQLGIDPNRIGVWGHSAGGHLAALLGTSSNSDALDGSVGEDSKTSSAVQCVVDMSGPIDLSIDFRDGMISQWLGSPVGKRQDLAKKASPLTYIDPADPPVLIVHGTQDPLVDIHRHAETFYKALRQANVQVEYLPVEGAGHMIVNPRVYVRAAAFFDEHLAGHSADAVGKFLGPNAAGGDNAPASSSPQRPAESGAPAKPEN